MIIRSFFSKIKFAGNFSPLIEKKSDWKRYVPDPYKAILLISADLEMAWAWQYAKGFTSDLSNALEKARLERINTPKLLNLCDNYSMPVTWATIGHLFLEACDKNGAAHPNLLRPPFFESDFWRFVEGDWFQHDPCSNYKTAPEWYCPDIIDLILNSKTRHEIGCHTFSHIDCQEGTCPPDLLRTELSLCKELAREKRIELRSFIHPGHMIGNLDVIAEQGFTNFRTDYRNVLGYPQKHESGLWELKQTAEFVYRKEWSIAYHITRYIEILKRAMSSNTICIFWFHPSFDSILIDKVLPEVFRFIDDNRDKLWVATHGEYIEWLNSG